MRRAPVMTAALSILAACSGPKPLSVDGAYVRLAAVPAQPSAGYFTIHGGPQPATLIAVSADTAIVAKMHRSMQSGGMASMTPIDRLAIPAKGIVRFAPGGLHVMLSGINPTIKRGGTMHLTFSFADGTRLVQDADVIAAGDPAPK